MGAIKFFAKWLLLLVAGSVLVATTVVGLVFAGWTFVPVLYDYWVGHARSVQFEGNVQIDKVICAAAAPGLLESSDITVLQINAEDASALQESGLAFLSDKHPASGKDGWRTTGWVPAGTDFDLLPDGMELTDPPPKWRSRGVGFLMNANGFTGDECAPLTDNLVEEERPYIAFSHPQKWPVEQCTDSCLAFLLFPKAGVAIAATWD